MKGKRGEKIFLALFISFSLPGILSATCSFGTHIHSFSGTERTFKNSTNKVISFGRKTCVHGFCTQGNICTCNPCWSGPTCQDYVDRFSPRFLAEEPFFILNYENLPDSATASPMMSSSPSSSLSPQPSSTSSSKFFSSLINTNSYYFSNDRVHVPLFRIESSDDDLGLTCQLGEVGPSATCPCATPRYSVTGQSSRMFYTDQETGDVFLRDGYSLQPRTHYIITLQVSALEVKDAIEQNIWEEEINVRLYIRHKQNESDEMKNLKLFLKNLQSTKIDDDKIGSREDKVGSNIFSITQREALDKSTGSLEFNPGNQIDFDGSIGETSLRFKRQTQKREGKSENIWTQLIKNKNKTIHISFLLKESHTEETFFVEEEIKIRIGIELSSVIPIQGFLDQKTRLEITSGIEGDGKLLNVAILRASISYNGSNDINYPSVEFSSTQNTNSPDTATWNIVSKEKMLIPIDLVLFVYWNSEESKLEKDNEKIPFDPKLRIEVQISFPKEDKKSRVPTSISSLIKDPSDKILQRSIQFPIRKRKVWSGDWIFDYHKREVNDEKRDEEVQELSPYPISSLNRKKVKKKRDRRNKLSFYPLPKITHMNLPSNLFWH